MAKLKLRIANMLLIFFLLLLLSWVQERDASDPLPKHNEADR